MSQDAGPEPRGPQGEGSDPPQQASDTTGGERGTTKSSGPSPSRIDPFSPADIALRELMKTQTVERSQWRTRVIWFVVALLAGAILAAVLAAIN